MLKDQCRSKSRGKRRVKAKGQAEKAFSPARNEEPTGH